jgi:hypothetical protein
MLPPQETVLASGTVQYGHGVFFKLKPSTQTTLEGKKSFSAIFAVPRGWRGGCLKVQCQALGLDRGIVPNLDREVPSGLATFYLALYLAGDDQAESLAQRLGVREQKLLDALAQYRTMSAASHRPFSWSTWKWPKFGDKSALAADVMPTEESLFNYVLSTPAQPMRAPESFPAAVQDRFQALQQAAVALEGLSVGTTTAAPSFTGSRASFFAPPGDQAAAESMKRQSTATAPIKTPPANAGNLGGSQPHSPDDRGIGSSTQTNLPKRGGTASCSAPGGQSAKSQLQSQPLRSAANDGVRQAHSEGRGTAKSADTLSKEAWYLLASMWGAVFTYIVAPLVVHFITNRKEYVREHSSAGPRA